MSNLEAGKDDAKKPFWLDIFDINTDYRSSVLYTAMFFIVGLLVALQTFTPFQLAANVDRTTTEIGTTLAAYGAGLFLGLLCLKIRSSFLSVDTLMVIILLATIVTLIALPFNRNLTLLYLYTFVLGACLSMVETSAMFLIRKINKERAGVWLGLTGSCLSMGFFTVPFIMLLTNDNIYAEYFSVAAATTGVAIILCWKIANTPATEAKAVKNVHIELPADEENGADQAEKDPEDHEQDHEQDHEPASHSQVERSAAERPHLHVEYVIFIILFAFVGMENSIGVYLQQYLDEDSFLDSGLKNSYQTVFICTSSFSKFAVPAYQYYFPKPRQIRFLLNVSNLINVFTCILWIALSSITDKGVSLDRNSGIFYTFLAVNGLSTGGSMSLMYDVVNSLTHATKISTMILTAGIYIGSSLYPWLLSVVWERNSSPYRHEVYPYSTLIMAVLVLVFCPVLPMISYIPNSDENSNKQEMSDGSAGSVILPTQQSTDFAAVDTGGKNGGGEGDMRTSVSEDAL